MRLALPKSTLGAKCDDCRMKESFVGRGDTPFSGAVRRDKVINNLALFVDGTFIS